MMGLLNGKNIIVTGLANNKSIAWWIACALQYHGANVLGTVLNERSASKIRALEEAPKVFIMDVSDTENIAMAIDEANHYFDDKPIDCIVHCLAFADREALTGRFLDTTREQAIKAVTISAFSLLDMAKIAEPYMAENGSVIYLTFAASERNVPHYNIMSVCKSALERIGMLLAHELGESKRIRVNGISAGPVQTLSARAIGRFNEIEDVYGARAPLGLATKRDIANAAVYLASELCSITGEVLHVDGGFTIMAINEREKPMEIKEEVG